MDKIGNIITSNRRKLEEFYKKGIEKNNLEHIPLDLTIEKNVINLFNHIKEKYKKLDLLVNCIGGSLYTHTIKDFPISHFDKVIAVNLRSAFMLTKEAIKLMNNNGSGGNIIHFVSSSAKNIAPGRAPYGAAKAGLAHLIHYAAAEAAEYNIKVNGISPTYVFTERHEQEIRNKSKKTDLTREEIINKNLKIKY
ncbi:MAG: SDR family oxidoreductase [Candidatus Lokiarchaeota archaeon]|nr:SDR family oxidoreductase [Candidatus Lokiarchaeota archaeon]